MELTLPHEGIAFKSSSGPGSSCGTHTPITANGTRAMQRAQTAVTGSPLNQGSSGIGYGFGGAKLSSLTPPPSWRFCELANCL